MSGALVLAFKFCARYRVQVRASNTEPIMRIMAEAPTAKEAEKLCEELLNFISASA